MKRFLACAFLVAACSSSTGNQSDSGSQSSAGGSMAHAGAGGKPSPGGGSSSSGASSRGGSGGREGTVDAAGADGAVVAAGAGAAGESETGASGAENGGESGSGDCTAARAVLLGAVDTVATGAVTVLGTSAGVTTLYVDASAGGVSSAAGSPWLFVDLESASKVSVTDVSSISSTAWDLAFKRPALYSNDGDGGPGQGGAVLIAKDFDAVTADDATTATFGTETFFDAECNPQLDPAHAVLTTFSSWYDYDPGTHVLTPAAGTWLVRGASGKPYKLQIQTYYSTPDGQVGAGDGGTYLLKVGAL